MERTLNAIGVQKIASRLANSVSHAAYTLNGAPQQAAVFKRVVEGNTARVYIYFDDTISGEIANIQLVDTDGDVIAGIDRTYTKPTSKGLYVAFKYDIQEVEVEVNAAL